MRTTKKFAVESLEPRIVLSGGPPVDHGPDFQDVIVWLNEGVTDSATLAREVTDSRGGEPGHVYKGIMAGFSARLPQAAIEALQKNPNVASVQADEPVYLLQQTLPTGINRVDADENPTAAIDETPNAEWPFILATIDTGVDMDNSDLNVVGGINFVRSAGDPNYDDGNGHGTHVAGTMAAIDNTEAVVGMAPGAGIWAARAFGNNGSGKTSDILAAMQEIVQLRQKHNNGEVGGLMIAVVNMSFYMYDRTAAEPYLKAMTEAGIVPVAAAGNFGGTSATFPARDPHTISVAALADSNGADGDPGEPTSAGPDETLADFSSCCKYVDLAAPGVDILSTWKGDRTKVISGTSMASPHVAGAAALLIQDYWDGELPQDELDVVLVREAIVRTANVRGDKIHRQDDANVGTYVLVADGNWVAPPVVSIVDIIDEEPTQAGLQGKVTVSVDARDMDTDAPGSVEVRIGADACEAVGKVGTIHSFTCATVDTIAAPPESMVPEGIHLLTAKACNGPVCSNSEAPLTVNNQLVFVDNFDEPPSVTFIQPDPNASEPVSVSGTVTIVVDVQDDRGLSDTVDPPVEIAVAKTEFPEDVSALLAYEDDDGLWKADWVTTEFDNVGYTIEVVATDNDTTGEKSTTADLTVSVENPQDPSGEVHVGSFAATTDVKRQWWKAMVTLGIHDTFEDPPGSAVTFAGEWSYGDTVSAATSTTSVDTGTVLFESDRLSRDVPSVTFTVLGITAPDAYTYMSSMNHNGAAPGTGVTSITVSRGGVVEVTSVSMASLGVNATSAIQLRETGQSSLDSVSHGAVPESPTDGGAAGTVAVDFDFLLPAQVGAVDALLAKCSTSDLTTIEDLLDS